MTDLISRAELNDLKFVAIKGDKVEEAYRSGWNDAIGCIIENALSAEAEDRLYIKIYAEDEPSVKAEKLYQICDETQNREVAEWLKEYFPSADAVQGWIIGKPIEQGKYMVTLDFFGHKFIDLFHYGKPTMPNRKVRGKCWYRCDDEWGDVVYDDTDILAWMPLPKPYGERREP